MKGITPIISIIILLLITIGLASAAWTYMSGYMNNLISRTLDVTPASCIGGTQVTFLVRNAGTNNVGTTSINVIDLSDASQRVVTWKFLNNTDAPADYVIKAGETVRALLGKDLPVVPPTSTSACTKSGEAKTCKYELTLLQSTWKQDLFVACTG
jgi:flagellin-like protein